MKRIVTIILTVFALALTTVAPSFGATGTPVAPAKTNMRTLGFAIENMTCALCPITVRKAMKKVKGVKKVKVDFKTKTATVTFDPAETTAAAIAAASANAGYPAKAIEVKTP